MSSIDPTKFAHRARVLKHCDEVAARARSTRTFYAVVTEYDCDPNVNPPGSEFAARGPLLVERYLDSPDALSEEATREIAKRFRNYGWARVAKVTIEFPEDETAQTSTPAR